MKWREKEKERESNAKLFAGALTVTLFIYGLIHWRSISLSSISTSNARSLSPGDIDTSFLRPISDHDAVDVTPGEIIIDAKDPIKLNGEGEGWGGPIKQRLKVRKNNGVLQLRANSKKENPRSIKIDSPLPSTSQLNPDLLKLWDRAFNSLSTAAGEHRDAALTRLGRKRVPTGIPGTWATTESQGRDLQEYLDCVSGRGEWVYDPEGGRGAAGLTVHKYSGMFAGCDKRFYKGGKEDGDGDWNVRESLKWRWVPSGTCFKARQRRPLSRVAFCQAVGTKSLLLVGDTLQYSLHDMILDWTTTEPQTCYGDLYCKEHVMCRDILRKGNSKDKLEDWSLDERVFHHLPLPPNSQKNHLHRRSIESTESPSADHDDTGDHDHSTSSTSNKSKRAPNKVPYLRYRRSDGLEFGGKTTSPVFIHPSTGIREINMHWMAYAERNDIVVLTKPPLPLPLRGVNGTWDEWWDSAEVKPTERMVEAAWRITEDAWLPEMVDTLRTIRAQRSDQQQLVVYRGGWRSHQDCGVSFLESPEEGGGGGDEVDFAEWDSPGDGPPPHSFQPSLRKLLYGGRAGGATDVHTAFYNIQTIFQNHLVRTILAPALGIAYLDLESTLSVWRSGMLGGSAAAPFQADLGLVDQSKSGKGGIGVGLRSSASGDCLRYCIPTPGMAMEEAVLGGLLRLLERD
ncbi:hypothetical protein T439DRAFT_329487 [Meredithblackwellia eburnea MCA 4105]